MTLNGTISHLKHVYCPNLCVGSAFQILDIRQYACVLKRGSALILNQDPIFETASNRLLKNVKSKTRRKAEFMCRN